MKKTYLWIALLVIVGSMLSACSGAASPSLAGSWKLSSYGPVNSQTPAVENVDTDITFDAGKLSGGVGCNSFGGDYKVEGSKIVFGTLSSTMMACDEPLMQQESAAFSVLANTAEFKLDGSTLTITSADGQSVVVLARK